MVQRQIVGTLIGAWASRRSFKPKGSKDDGGQDGGGRCGRSIGCGAVSERLPGPSGN